MSSEMIDRVAVGIFKSHFHPIDVATEAQVAEHRVWFADDWRRSERSARAAVEAMREPTVAMLHAHLDVAPQMWADVYRAMIDAALKDAA